MRAPEIVSAAGLMNTVYKLLPAEGHDLWPEAMLHLKVGVRFFILFCLFFKMFSFILLFLRNSYSVGLVLFSL